MSVLKTYYCTTHYLPITTMTCRMSRETLKIPINHLLALFHHQQHLDYLISWSHVGLQFIMMHPINLIAKVFLCF